MGRELQGTEHPAHWDKVGTVLDVVDLPEKEKLLYYRFLGSKGVSGLVRRSEVVELDGEVKRLLECVPEEGGKELLHLRRFLLRGVSPEFVRRRLERFKRSVQIL